MKTYVIRIKHAGKFFWYNLQKSMTPNRDEATNFILEEATEKVNELLKNGVDNVLIISANEFEESYGLTISAMSQMIHENARKKGFRENAISLKESLMNVVVELSEAIQEARKENAVAVQIINGVPEGILVELADAIMLILEECAFQGWDMETAIMIKHRYNLTRPKYHGHKLK